jgi:endonuclease YncB( thermonuclease family)
VSAARALILALVVAAQPASAQDIVAPAVRDVTPPGVTPGPKGEGPLIREPTPPRPPEPPRWRRYFLPTTTDAATFAIDGRLAIRISGVTPPSVDGDCSFSDGETWPCGRTALHAFRMFLRRRAVECYFPPVNDIAEVTAPCRVGETDLGRWLLAAGWARTNALATGEYRPAEAEARCANAGIWQGSARPDDCPARSEPEPYVQAEPDVYESDAGPWLPD